MANMTQLSKFIALVLRHKAQDFGLDMDENGFVPVIKLWEVTEKKFGNQFIYTDLEEIVSGDRHGKKRYEIIDGKIRAMFGHSNGVVTIEYPVIQPPEYLYHGTSLNTIESIKRNGLETRNRQYVHLTTNINNASRVANRHAKDIKILVVNASKAYNNGIIFYQPEDEHYLCKHIPPQYIDFEKPMDSVE